MICIKKLRSSLPFNVIGAIVVLLCVFGIIAGALGLINFADGLRREYSVSTYHMADTATTLVNGDHLEDYLKGERTDEYQRTRDDLELFCHKISVSLIYVIQADQSDYGSFVSVFNLVDNSVDNSDYIPWELGYTRNITNDEYWQKYKAIYEEGSAYETIYRLHTTDGQHPHITTMVPVYNSTGEVCAILCMQRPARELADYGRIYLINIMASTAILSVLAGAVAIWFLRRKIIGPSGRFPVKPPGLLRRTQRASCWKASANMTTLLDWHRLLIRWKRTSFGMWRRQPGQRRKKRKSSRN